MKKQPTNSLSPLRLARQLRGLSAKALAESVGKSGAWISNLERGMKEIPEDAAHAFAEVLDVPVGFILRGPVEREAGVLHFRHKKRTPAAQRARVDARAVLIELLVGELESEFEELYRPAFPEDDPLPGVPGDPERLSLVDRAAQNLRAEWGMGEGPIPDLIKLVEVRGCWVIELPPEDRSVDAFSWWGDSHGFIALNPVPLDGSDRLSSPDTPRNPYRERFNVAHELGHLLLHPDLAEDSVGTRDVENEAHRFAASFLVPARQWMATSPRSLQWRDYRSHAHRWGVSVSVLLRRNYDLGIFDEPRYRSAMIRLSSEIGRKKEGLHLPPRPQEVPGRLLAHLDALRAHRGIGLGHLARRIDVYESEIAQIVGVAVEHAPPPTKQAKVLHFPKR